MAREVLDTAILAEITASPVLVHRWALAADAVGFEGESYAAGFLQDVDPGGDAMDGPSGPTSITFLPPEGVDWNTDPGPLETVLRWVWRVHGTIEWRQAQAVRGRFSGLRRDEDGRFTVEIERLAGGFGDVNPRTWSHEDQQATYPGDRGFEFLATLADEGIRVPWPPAQGYAPRIGPAPAAEPGPPDQVTDSPGTVEIFGGFGVVAIPGSITATLYDLDQPLRDIVWTWQRRAGGTGEPADIEGAEVRDRNRAAYATVAGDVGDQIRATVAYRDAHGTGKTATSGWVSVVAGGGGGNGNGGGDSGSDGGDT